METQDYESLTDPHLNAYFNNKRIRRHLIKAGLINRHGDILPPPSYEVVLAQRGKREKAKEKLSHTIINYVIEEERKRQAFIRDQFDFAVKRSRIQKTHESRHQQQLSILNTLVQISKPPKSRNARTPSPTTRKRSASRAKSARPPTRNVKYKVVRRPPTAKSSNDDYCEVTMIYYGPQIMIDHDSARVQPHGDEIVVMQQHCGGENLVVFKGFVKPNETFTFESRRHPGYPFAVAIYINSLIDSRISVCCEYKHSRNVRLGSTRGLFGIYDVRKSKPCLVCQYANRNKKTLSNSNIPDNSARYRKSVVPRIPFTTEFGSGDILRTPKSSPERHEQISKERINRISTAAQASSRTQSPASSNHKDETKNNISTSTLVTKSTTTDQQQIDKKTFRVPSGKSKKSDPSSATVSFENGDPHHSSAPIFTTGNTNVKKNDNDSSRSSTSTSKKSGSVPIRTSDNKADRRRLKSPTSSSEKSSPSPVPIVNNKTDPRKTRSPSIASSEGRRAPVPFLNNEDHRRRVISPSTTSSASRHSPALILNNGDGRQSSRSSSTSSSKSGSEPIPIFNDDDDRQSLRSSTSSTTKSIPSTPHILNNDPHSPEILPKKDDHRDHFFSSSSSTTPKGRDSSLSDFFAKKDDHPTPKIPTENIDTRRKTSISSTSTSTTPDMSTKIKPNGKLIKGKSERRSSSSSAATLILSSVLPPDDQYKRQHDSSPSPSELSESNHHSIKHVAEPHRSPTPAMDYQQTNDGINKSDDDSKSESKPTRRNQDEARVTTTPVKKTVRQYHSVENIIVIWLDAAVDNTTQDILDAKFQLRQIARTIRTFTDPEKCLQLIKEIKHEKIFLIVSGRLSENVLPQIDADSQLAVIYIFCQQNSKYEHLTTKYPKIKKIYTDIWKICEDLKVDAKQWNNDLSTFQVTSSIDDDSTPLTSEQSLFIHNQLFKEYLLDIQYDDDVITDLVEYCNVLYAENETEKESIKQFETDYNRNEALNWYTKDCFIYHMLNKAIRMKDIKILYQMGFLLRDINQKLEDTHSSTVHRSTLTVFRGQGMKLEYFEELKQNQGGLISFNGFVSTSVKQNVAYDFAKRSLSNGFPIAVLFRMKIDPKNSSNPFASIENQSANQSENEILFSFKTIFHIESIEQMENNLWQIDLSLINEKENNIVQFIQIERQKLNHLTDYEKLGELLIEMNEFDRAKDIYELNLPSITNPKYTFVYKQLALISTKIDAHNQALFYYDLALRTKSNETLNDYVTISDIHNQIGKIYYKQYKFREALEKFQYALNMQLEHLSSEHPALIETYGCLAIIYEDSDDYETALGYYENQLQIQKNLSSSNQSDLALTHYKIAICLENLGRSDEAINHIQQSIDITPSDEFELNERQVALERIREQLK